MNGGTHTRNGNKAHPLTVAAALLLAAFAMAMAMATAMPPSSADAAPGKPYFGVYGDSLETETFPHLDRAMHLGGYRPLNRTAPGTSPCDWFQRVASDASRLKPAGAIVESFGNALSKCQERNGNKPYFDSTAYWKLYEADLRALLGRFDPQTKVWLVAPPAWMFDRRSGYSHKARMFALMTKLAAERPDTVAIDAGAAVEGPGGTYASSLPCLAEEPCEDLPRPGFNRMHSFDGLHFCPVLQRATQARDLSNCPVTAPGARRFARAQLAAVLGAAAAPSAG